MKIGRDLSALATELQRQVASKKDFLADTRRLCFRTVAEANPEHRIILDGVNGGMPLRPSAHAQMAATLSIPKAYYDRCLADAPDLLAVNVNRWLTTQPATKLIRTLDSQVRAILTDSYRPLDNLDLAEAVLPKLSELDAQVVSGEVTENRFYLKAVTDRIRGEVKVGDVIQAGVVVSNSEIGHGRLRMEALDYRLVCLNGMIRDAVIKKTHVGRSTRGDDALEDAREYFRDETRIADDRAFFLKVRDAVSGLFDPAKFNRRLDEYREAGARLITADPAQVVELTCKRLAINDAEQSGIMAHLIRGGDLSAWGLANAVTRYSQDVDSYDRATELEARGGDIVELPQTAWRAIQAAATTV